MWFAPERRSGRRWIVPGLTLAAGLTLAVALSLQGRTDAGLAALAVLAGYAAHLAYRRDEPALPISAAFGSGHRARAHLRAAAVTGDVTVAALVARWWCRRCGAESGCPTCGRRHWPESCTCCRR